MPLLVKECRIIFIEFLEIKILIMIPVLLKDILPNPRLHEYVRKYQVFRFLFEKDKIPPLKYHAPRPEHCITFYVRDVQKFSYFGSQTIISYPKCIINGMYNIPINRYGGYDFWAIKVVLQPTALYCLTGIPAQELTNTYLKKYGVKKYD